MRFSSFFGLIILLLIPVQTQAEVFVSDDCRDYASWEWAQSVHDWQPSTQSSLDPDGNGIACEELDRGGIVPAWWTDQVPDQVEGAMLYSIVDGDTLKVVIDDKEETVRLYRADTPELAACGGFEATNFVRDTLSLSDDGLSIWLEYDETKRDRYDRRLAYIWFTVDDRPYMLNEVLIRSGWARDVDYGDRLYANQLAEASNFANQWQLGQYDLCGGFDADSLSTTPLDEIEQEGPGAGQCDPAYPTVCIPPIEVTGDLDCGQIEFRMFEVLPPDPHRFDGDGNGWGCEGS